MTERLTALMRTEADRLDVPPPPTAVVLGRGRSLRRRRRGAQAGVGLAAVALVAGGVALVSGDDAAPDAIDPAGAPATPPDLGAVFAIGPQVHLTGPGVVAEVDDVVVKSMHYTPAGVLVRHGENPYSDGGGPQRFSLVTPDGTVEPIDVVTEEVVPGVDTGQPLLAYAEVVGGTVEVVVHDLTTDAEVARVPVPEARKWGGWSAPPVSLTGDEVYVGTADVARVVDWRTGAVREEPSVEPGYPPSFHGDRSLVDTRSGTSVVDTATGETLLAVEEPEDGFAYVTLSPDGRFARTTLETFDSGGFDVGPTVVTDVGTGAEVELEGGGAALEWSPSGQLVRLDPEGVLTTCSPTTGACTSEQLDLDVLPDSLPGAEDFSDDLVLGNEVRES
jgi:hypothetical protein